MAGFSVGLAGDAGEASLSKVAAAERALKSQFTAVALNTYLYYFGNSLL